MLGHGKEEQLWNIEGIGEYLLPYVAYKGNEIVTGYGAKKLFGMDRQFAVGCVKKLIGLTYESYLKLERIFLDVMMVILTLL